MHADISREKAKCAMAVKYGAICLNLAQFKYS